MKELIFGIGLLLSGVTGSVGWCMYCHTISVGG